MVKRQRVKSTTILPRIATNNHHMEGWCRVFSDVTHLFHHLRIDMVVSNQLKTKSTSWLRICWRSAKGFGKWLHITSNQRWKLRSINHLSNLSWYSRVELYNLDRCRESNRQEVSSMIALSLPHSIDHLMFRRNRNTVTETWSRQSERLRRLSQPNHSQIIRAALDADQFELLHSKSYLCCPSYETHVSPSIIEAVHVKKRLASHLHDDFFQYYLWPDLSDYGWWKSDAEKQCGVCPKTNKIGETIWLDTYPNIINDRVDVLIANANR